MGAGWNPILITLGIGVGAATYKEFVFDTSLLKNLPVIGKWAFFQGEGDSWSDSLMDWSFYMLGGGIGMGISWLAHHLATMHCVASAISDGADAAIALFSM